MRPTTLPVLAALSDIVLSRDARLRIRIQQWMIASLVYAGAAMLPVSGLAQGWMATSTVVAWCTFVAAVLCAGYLALRSGWSERFADPAMTMWQLGMGVIAVLWGYMICGPMRTSALLPLMIIFAFGAFSLSRRQIGALTLFALAGLACVIWLRRNMPWLAGASEGAVADPLLYDLNNLLMVVVVLPALAIIAARLSGLRRALRKQKSALAAALGEVKRLATCDELTGVPNRRSMVEALADAAGVANQGGRGFCVVMIDVDRFKQVNDTLGHAQGDAMLRAFAQTAARGLRDSDLFGRWGGEEFLFLLPGVDPAGARRIIERLQGLLRDTPLAGQVVTFSGGVSAYRPGEAPDATVARADAAMYRAKDAGRDTVCMEQPA